MQVRQERTNWRDSLLKEIHDEEKFPLPLNDLGFLVLEYDHGKPIALINYEKFNKPLTLTYQESMNNLRILADSLSPRISVFDVRYSYQKELDIIDKIKVTPINETAKGKIAHIDDYVILTEKEFIFFLYSLRNGFEKGFFISAKLEENNWKIGLKNKNTLWDYEIISHRHRDYGWDVPVVDIDFIYFKNSKPIALIEYKEDSSTFNLDESINHPTIKALNSLTISSSYKIPFFLVRYTSYEKEINTFVIFPVNKKAKEIVSNSLSLSREEYFSFVRNLEKDIDKKSDVKELFNPPEPNIESTTFIGNKNNFTFHLPNCMFVPSNENKKINFNNIKDAENAGYKPCKNCRPDKKEV